MNINFGGKNLVIHLRDDADQSVFNEIFKVREYRSADEAIKSARFPIVDVGAHAGFFVCYCRALNENAKIFAVEPESKNLEALKKHIKDNNYLDIEVVEGALAKDMGIGSLVISPDSHNHRLSNGDIAEGETVKVKTYSFSGFCKKNKIKKISLLKMDIEGGEYEVFDGLSADDLNMVNFVILEYHYGKEYKKIEDKLRENGFGVQVFPSKFEKTMGFLFAKNKRFK